jgi:hypothetical protein
MLGKTERGMGTAIIRQHFSANKLTIYHITEYEDKIKENVMTSDPPEQLPKDALL